MKEISKGRAEAIGAIATLAFAFLLWWYVVQGSSEITMFIIFGIVLLFMDVFALRCLLMKTTKKKGRK